MNIEYIRLFYMILIIFSVFATLLSVLLTIFLLDKKLYRPYRKIWSKTTGSAYDGYVEGYGPLAIICRNSRYYNVFFFESVREKNPRLYRLMSEKLSYFERFLLKFQLINGVVFITGIIIPEILKMFNCPDYIKYIFGLNY